MSISNRNLKLKTKNNISNLSVMIFIVKGLQYPY